MNDYGHVATYSFYTVSINTAFSSSHSSSLGCQLSFVILLLSGGVLVHSYLAYSAFDFSLGDWKDETNIAMRSSQFIVLAKKS